MSVRKSEIGVIRDLIGEFLQRGIDLFWSVRQGDFKYNFLGNILGPFVNKWYYLENTKLFIVYELCFIRCDQCHPNFLCIIKIF